MEHRAFLWQNRGVLSLPPEPEPLMNRLVGVTLVMVLAVSCSGGSGDTASTPAAPSAPTPPPTPQPPKTVITTADYASPGNGIARTGEHRITWWHGSNTISMVKGHDPQHIEQWEFSDNAYRLSYDRTDGTGTAYRLELKSGGLARWLPATWAVGDEIIEADAMLRRVDMTGRQLDYQPFPFRVRLVAAEQQAIGGDIGTVDVIRVDYEPVPSATGRCPACVETFIYAKGLGIVAWQSQRDPRGMLWFNKRTTDVTPLGTMAPF